VSAIHVVVMGVSGCGKSTVGRELAGRLGLPFVEGDDFHAAASIGKMKHGLPLTDEDRAGWLRQLARELASRASGAVLACSALKRSYRDLLRTGAPDVRFLHLSLTPAQALARVASRKGHYYPASLVASQFETLEDPSGEPGVRVVDAMRPIDEIATEAAEWLRRPS
jgi:gluconokinase